MKGSNPEGERWQTRPKTWSVLKDAARDNRHTPTLAERVLWSRLRGSQLQGVRFRRQHTIGSYIVDFYAAAAKLVVEADGEIHRQQTDDDRARDEFLEAAGLKVLRFENEEVVNRIDDVLARIRAEL